MKTAPITPARIDFDHPRDAAAARARQVFLRGNDLPARWARRARFTIVDTGFGLGDNFLAAWQAWRDDPARCTRLHYVAFERHPPAAADLARAHAASPHADLAAALRRAWPPLTPNVHALDFDAGRVQLLLALGDATQLLPALRMQAEAFFVDGSTPARDPSMGLRRIVSALTRCAAPGATLASSGSAPELGAALASVGFDVHVATHGGDHAAITRATFAPRFAPRRALPAPAPPDPDHAIVVGAGIAGAAAAQALARQGLRVTVLERHQCAAAEASGNPGGLFHGTVHRDDAAYARLFRAAALQAQQAYGASGLLRVADDLPAMQALLQRQGLPPEYVRALGAAEASALAGVPLATPAWHYPGGGWVAPAAWVAQALAHPGIALRSGAAVQRIARVGAAWQAFDASGRTLAEAPLLLLANAAGAAPLLEALGHTPWPLRRSRGQVTFWQHAAGHAQQLKLALAGDGYVLPLPGGLLCGGASEWDDNDAGAAGVASAEPPTRDADDIVNVQRLQRWTGLTAPRDATLWHSRGGWRVHSADSLPIAGALTLTRLPSGQRLDQPRLLPREAGLFVLTALAGRGLTWAPLLARLIAAQACGAPWPLEQDLADAVDPARWIVRAARRPAAQAL